MSSQVNARENLLASQSLAKIAILSVVFVLWTGFASCAFAQKSNGADSWEATHSMIGTQPQDGHYSRRLLRSFWDAGLFQIAKEHCQTQRGSSKSDSDSYALWTMWMIEGLGREAQTIDRASGNQEWSEEIEAIVKEYASKEDKQKRLPWVELERIRCYFRVAQSDLANYLAAPARKDSREACLASVRKILDQLNAHQKQVAEWIAMESNKPAGKNEVPKSVELQSLLNESILIEIECFELQGQCYEEQSSDCIAAGTRMMKGIEEAKTRISTDWSGYPKLELARVSALLLQSDYSKSIRSALDLRTKISDESSKVRLLALLAQSYRRSNKFAEANKTLEEAGSWTSSPQIAIERLALQLDLLKSVSASNDNTQGLQEAIDFKKKIGDQFGPYWLQRAEAVLVSRGSSSPETAMTNGEKTPSNPPTTSKASVEIQFLVTEAKQLLAAKNWKSAVEKLKKAEALAADSRDGMLALKLGQQAGALLQKEGDWAGAANQFREAAIRSSDEDNSSNVHLMSAWVLSQHLNWASKPETENHSKLFFEVLDEHLQKFGKSASAKQARLWLDDLHMARGDLGAAISLWQNAWNDVQDETTALMLTTRLILPSIVERSWGPIDEYQKGSDERVALLQKSDFKFLGSYLSQMRLERRWGELDSLSDLSKDETWKEASSPLKQTVLLSQNTLVLAQKREGMPEGLATEFEARVKASPDLRSLALPWFVSLFEALESCPSEIRKTWVPLLKQLAMTSDGVKIGGVAGKSLEQRKKLLAQRIASWEGERATAKGELEKLVSGKPNLQVDFEWGAFLVEAEETRAEGLNVYRKIAQSNPGSDSWWEAKFRIASILKDTGKRQEASDLLKLAKATYPNPSKKWIQRLAKWQ